MRTLGPAIKKKKKKKQYGEFGRSLRGLDEKREYTEQQHLFMHIGQGKILLTRLPKVVDTIIVMNTK